MKKYIAPFGVVIIILMIIVAYLKYLGWNNTDIAAWVQAIGSILSILASIWISYEQPRIHREEKLKSILAVVEAANERAKKIDIALSELKKPIPAEFYETCDKSIITGMVRTLNGIPVHEIGSHEEVASLLLLHDQYIFLGLAIETLIRNQNEEIKFNVGINNAQKHIGHIKRCCDSLINGLTKEV